MKEGAITGLRIDHIDGLYDQDQYLLDLQKAFTNAVAVSGRSAGPQPNCYVVVEKILNRHDLHKGWQTHGQQDMSF